MVEAKIVPQLLLEQRPTNKPLSQHTIPSTLSAMLTVVSTGILKWKHYIINEDDNVELQQQAT
jgi:hypothetical protein